MLDAKEEAQKIYEISGQDYLKSIQLIEQQLNVVHTRAQVMVGIAGMVITVTGFSGRQIVETSDLAQYLVVIGLGVVLAATLWVFLRVMIIHWATASINDDPLKGLNDLITYRNQKTMAYEIGGKILGIGLICYGTAVSLMLFA